MVSVNNNRLTNQAKKRHDEVMLLHLTPAPVHALMSVTMLQCVNRGE
jgi:hypothetical protein